MHQRTTMKTRSARNLHKPKRFEEFVTHLDTRRGNVQISIKVEEDNDEKKLLTNDDFSNKRCITSNVKPRKDSKPSCQKKNIISLKQNKQQVEKQSSSKLLPAPHLVAPLDFDFEVVYKCKQCQYSSCNIDELRNHVLTIHHPIVAQNASTGAATVNEPVSPVSPCSNTADPDYAISSAEDSDSGEKYAKVKRVPIKRSRNNVQSTSDPVVLNGKIPQLVINRITGEVKRGRGRPKKVKDDIVYTARKNAYVHTTASEQRVTEIVSSILDSAITYIEGITRDERVTKLDTFTDIKLVNCEHIIDSEVLEDVNVDDIKSQVDKLVNEARAKNLTRQVYNKKPAEDSNKPHKCPECGQGFRNKPALNGHVYRRHSGLNPHFRHLRDKSSSDLKDPLLYQCPMCNKPIARPGLLAFHIATEHFGVNCREARKLYSNGALHNCEICSFSSNSQVKLTLHMVKHTGEKRFQCEVCGKRFSQKKSVGEHMLYKHPSDPDGPKRNFKCEICGKAFILKHNLQDHYNTHTKANNTVCDLCGGCYTSMSSLRQHKRAHHYKESNYKCPMCSHSSFSSSQLKGHLIAKHGHQTDHKCGTCGKCFLRDSLLRRHLRGIHKIIDLDHGAKCAICSKAFGNIESLRRHKKQVHKHKSDDSKCSICGKIFALIEEMQHHTRQVHGGDTQEQKQSEYSVAVGSEASEQQDQQLEQTYFPLSEEPVAAVEPVEPPAATQIVEYIVREAGTGHHLTTIRSHTELQQDALNEMLRQLV